MVDLSIIIVSWNTRDLLAECLQSLCTTLDTSAQLAAQAPRLPPLDRGDLCIEVWTVDNASTDGSVQLVRERFPWTRLIENQENTGFARANNRAIRQSSGRYVLLLNPDTQIRPGALESLVHFMDEHPEAGAAGAQILNPDETLQTSCYPAPTLTRELWRMLHLDALWLHGEYRMADWSLDKPREIEAALGACLILRTKALNQVGLLDESYFMYSEEIDLCHRLRQAGWHVYWVPQARVLHHGGQSTRQVATAMFLRLYQGKIRYFRKHYGQSSARLYKLILLLSSLPRLLLGPLARLERPPHRQRHLALAGNYRRLITALPEM